jgi:hypothetical protein
MNLTGKNTNLVVNSGDEVKLIVNSNSTGTPIKNVKVRAYEQNVAAGNWHTYLFQDQVMTDNNDGTYSYSFIVPNEYSPMPDDTDHTLNYNQFKNALDFNSVDMAGNTRGSEIYFTIASSSNENEPEATANLELTIPESVTITESHLVDTSGSQSQTNDNVNNTINGLTPFTVSLSNIGSTSSEPVRIAPINGGSHIQLWAKDSNNNWFDINTVGWMPTSGVVFPAGYNGSTDIYAISDATGTYNLTTNLVKVSDQSIVASSSGVLNVDEDNSENNNNNVQTQSFSGGSLPYTFSTFNLNPTVTTPQSTSGSTGSVLGATVFQFTRNLGVGSIGDDVIALQKFLNLKGYLVATVGAGSPGNETNYFGSRTMLALKKYQEANPTILTNAGIYSGIGTGYFGQNSMDFINNILLTDSVTSAALEK